MILGPSSVFIIQSSNFWIELYWRQFVAKISMTIFLTPAVKRDAVISFGISKSPLIVLARTVSRLWIKVELVIAIDEQETAIKIVESVRRLYPKLPIFSRVFDRIHAYKLLHLGVTEVAIETSGSALALGTEVLKTMGLSIDRAQTKAQLFYVNNQKSIHELSKRYLEDDTETFIQASKQLAEQLEAMLRTDPEKLLENAYSDIPSKETQWFYIKGY